MAGSALGGDYGLLGLLSVIRMTDADRNALALGTDLTLLGLNLNSTENLYSTFGGPWSDAPATKEPHYQVRVIRLPFKFKCNCGLCGLHISLWSCFPGDVKKRADDTKRYCCCSGRLFLTLPCSLTHELYGLRFPDALRHYTTRHGHFAAPNVLLHATTSTKDGSSIQVPTRDAFLHILRPPERRATGLRGARIVHKGVEVPR